MISKRKFYMLVLLCTSVLLMLTSCVRSGVNINIKEDGSGFVEVSYGVAENYYNSMLEQSDTDIFEGKQTGLVSEDGKDYVCYVENKQFNSYDELKDILLDLEYDTTTLSSGDTEEETDDTWESEVPEDYHIFKSVDAGKRSSVIDDTYYFTATVNSQKMDMDDLALLNLDAGDIFRLVISVTMPGEIKADGADIEGNTATFTITDLSQETVISAEGSQVNVVQIILFAVAFVLLIALVILLVCGKKKPKVNKEF